MVRLCSIHVEDPYSKQVIKIETQDLLFTKCILIRTLKTIESSGAK